MHAPAPIRVRVELPEEEAWALAQFLKRAGYTDYRGQAIDECEATRMRDAGERLREALAREGVAPR
jgi:hypothetical protein